LAAAKKCERSCQLAFPAVYQGGGLKEMAGAFAAHVAGGNGMQLGIDSLYQMRFCRGFAFPHAPEQRSDLLFVRQIAPSIVERLAAY
jgi:hypothetical protein